MPFFRKRPTPSPAPVAETASPPSGPTGILRKSTALKDFVLKIPEVDPRALLDLGRAFQTTITFFADRGFRIAVQPLLESWRQFVEEQQAQNTSGTETPPDPGALAQQFLGRELQFPPGSFHGVLASGGVLLALFHSERPAQRWSYRVRDMETIELIPNPGGLPVVNVFNNRQILNLFARFRSCTTYIARDQLREVLVVRE